MKKTCYLTVLLCLLCANPFCFGVSLLNVKTDGSTFNISNDKQWRLTLSISEPGKVTLFIYNQNMQIIRTLRSLKSAKSHTLAWDGLDELGNSVDSNIYFYRTQIEDKNGLTFSEDNTLRQGALDRAVYWPKWNKEKKEISFRQVGDSLVRVRVGLKHGGLIRTVADWVPVYGENPSIPWDGWDSSHVEDYSNRNDLRIDIAAISLPENHIIVCGSGELPQSFAGIKWIENAFLFNKNIAPDKVKAAEKLIGVKCGEQFAVKLETDLKKDPSSGGYILKGENDTIRIIVPDLDDKEKLGQSYEAVFFYDGVFLCESIIEDGKLLYTIESKEFTSGSHTIMVNVILGSSRIATSSMKVIKK